MAAAVTTMVLGVSSLDAVHHSSRVELGFGGVSKNVACALAQLGQAPVFVSPSHGSEWNAALEQHFAARQLNWRRWPIELPLPMYEAFLLPNGDVKREKFFDNGAFAPLSPALLRDSQPIWLDGADRIVASSDLHVRSLQAVQALCRARRVPFYLISSSVAKASRLPAVRPDLLAMNQAELRRLMPAETRHLDPEAEILVMARAAAELVSPEGVALITRGAAGALLVRPALRRVLHQPVPTLRPASTVGAGDRFFAALISQNSQGFDWPAALAEATRQTLQFLAPELGAVARDDLPPQHLLLWD